MNNPIYAKIDEAIMQQLVFRMSMMPAGGEYHKLIRRIMEAHPQINPKTAIARLHRDVSTVEVSVPNALIRDISRTPDYIPAVRFFVVHLSCDAFGDNGTTLKISHAYDPLNDTLHLYAGCY